MLNATHGTGAYTEKVTGYDKNGNITGLQRYNTSLVDNLTYTYNGNQLTQVEDATGNATGFTNGANTTNEYTYDNNGNLTKDLNKGISNISYNSLNLPSVVTFSNGNTITYLYTADGRKLRTVHVINGTATTTDYCGNVIYENGTQKLLLTEEGYINLNSPTTYYYYLKDHQGNNRVVVNSNGTVMETNHYYPFGSTFATSNVQPYKYNGKELDTKNGLNWYDYGARHYDAVLGRWHVVDPLAEKYYSTSPYTYCLNNPVKYIDPDGKKIVVGSWIGRVLAFFGVDNFEAKVQRDLAQLKKDNSDVAAMIKRLDDSEFEIKIEPISASRIKEGETGNIIYPDNKKNVTAKQGSRIEYNPDNRKTQGNRDRTPRVGLAHELGHADDLIQGKAVKFNSRKAKAGDKEEQAKGIENERHAHEMENAVSRNLNEQTRDPEDYYKQLNKSIGIK